MEPTILKTPQLSGDEGICNKVSPRFLSATMTSGLNTSMTLEKERRM